MDGVNKLGHLYIAHALLLPLLGSFKMHMLLRPSGRLAVIGRAAERTTTGFGNPPALTGLGVAGGLYMYMLPSLEVR
jgi:hypothetical protein